MSLNISILQCHHKNSDFLKNDIVQPIHVGAALSKEKLDYCIRDDKGENISHKNPYWCELTALYWQWKNVDADYYGLFHYRRIITFECKGGIEDNLEYNVQKKYRLLPKQIIKEINGFDMILPLKENIFSVTNSEKNITLYEQYDLDHNLNDLDTVFEIIDSKYPSIAKYIPELKLLKKCYYGNIFIMKKEYYQEYCSFLFDVLFELENKLNIDNYDRYQKRVYGFISERLLNLYIIFLSDKINLRIGKCGILYLSNKRPLKIKIKEQVYLNIENSSVNVCMAFDDNYFDHGMVVIRSMVENTNSFINLYILDGGDISSENKARCFKEFENNKISIKFISVDSTLLHCFPLNMGYISISTYYRLLLVEVFGDLEKIVYVDSDIIFTGDIYELWNENLDGRLIGACYDELGIYQERRLGFKEHLSYFNAGVMVFDIRGLKNKYKNIFYFYSEIYLNNKEKIFYQDQDILNIAHADDVKIINSRWNMCTGMFVMNINDVKYSQDCIEKMLISPGIIHYTGGYKPWKFFSNNPLSYLYWIYFNKMKYKKWSISKVIFFINNVYLRLGYRVNGGYINFHVLGKEFFRVKKSYLIKVKNYV